MPYQNVLGSREKHSSVLATRVAGGNDGAAKPTCSIPFQSVPKRLNVKKEVFLGGASEQQLCDVNDMVTQR